MKNPEYRIDGVAISSDVSFSEYGQRTITDFILAGGDGNGCSGSQDE